MIVLSDAKFAYPRPSKKDALSFAFNRVSPALETSVRTSRDDSTAPKNVSLNLCRFAGLISVCSGTDFGVHEGVLGTFVAPVALSEKLKIYFLKTDSDGVWTTVESHKPAKTVLEYSTLVSGDLVYLDHVSARLNSSDGRLFVFDYSSLGDLIVGLSDNLFQFDLSGKPNRNFDSEKFRSLFGLAASIEHLDVRRIIGVLGDGFESSIDLSTLF